MAQDGDELLLHGGHLAFVLYQSLLRLKPLFGFQTAPDDIGKHLEHGNNAGVFDVARFGINRAEGAKERPVAAEDRDGGIADDAELRGNRMVTIDIIRGDIVEHHFFRGLAHRLAEGLVDPDLVTFGQAKVHLVHRATGDPAIGRHPRHSSKAHICRQHYRFQQRPHSFACREHFDI